MEKIRIQDDLYEYVNGEWLEKAVIPDDRPTAGGFADLAKDVEELLINDLNEMCENNKYPNEYLERACALYKIIKNVEKRNKDGLKPCLKNLKRIEKLKDISSFNRYLPELIKDGFALPFTLEVDSDMKDTDHYLVYISGPSTILPDTTYYKEEMAAQRDAILGMWQGVAKQILAKTKLSAEDQEKYIADCLKFDAIIATLVKSSEEKSEYTKMYNIWSTRKASSALKPVKFNKLLVNLFGVAPKTVSVAEPRFVEGFNTLFNEENFELYKHWAYVNELIASCQYLSEELRDLGTMYHRALMGVPQMASVEKYAYQLVGAFYSEPIGLYYGEKYFGEAAKKDINEMVREIINTYIKRISNNDFLEQATKDKAVVKLQKMAVKMGYPDKVDEFYNELVFDADKSLYEIICDLVRIRKQHNLDKLNKTLNREEWPMPGHLVNACYNPFTNDITFPAAILQAPFYSIKQTRSQNLGGIGAVIGHEISHAFDNNGAQCDENGNLNNWWTKKDLKNFEKKTKDMIAEFEGITLPWGPVNSTLIVSENIADNGGMAVTLDIMGGMKEKNYEEYFINWAKVWCLKAKPEYLQILLRVDVHAPAVLRANIPPRNFTEWYDTFGVVETDKMYIPKEKRIVIW